MRVRSTLSTCLGRVYQALKKKKIETQSIQLFSPSPCAGGGVARCRMAENCIYPRMWVVVDMGLRLV